MGLFDKRDKKRGGKDDFDSPVEQIDLSAVPRAAEPARPAAAPVTAAAEPAPAPRAARDTGNPPTAEAAKEQPKEHPKMQPVRGTPEHEDYGIDKAIELMRTLPQENIELVVQVVKFSLQSVGIQLPSIIEDAIRRQKDIQGRIGVLKGEIAELEQEIKTRKEEIDRLEADHRETSMVRERLELAENLGKAKPASSSPSLPGLPPEDPRPRPDTASGTIPRVTRQTNPPPSGTSPLQASPSSSPANPTVKK